MNLIWSAQEYKTLQNWMKNAYEPYVQRLIYERGRYFFIE